MPGSARDIARVAYLIERRQELSLHLCYAMEIGGMLTYRYCPSRRFWPRLQLSPRDGVQVMLAFNF